MNEPIARAVTFDFGQTLAELDTAMLSRRLAERGLTVSVETLDRSVGAAWEAYNNAIRAGHGGHPWHLLMRTLLVTAGVAEADADGAAAWLFTLQPRSNLWRRPIGGMIDIVHALRAAGVKVGVVSNSEGGLALLIEEMGWTSAFDAVADSGALGMEKPGRDIFAWTAERLGHPMEEIVHIGDAWAADFVGARDAGMRAVLFRGKHFIPAAITFPSDARAAMCETADELRAILRAWSLPT